MNTGQRFTALDSKNGVVHAGLDNAVFVAIEGGYLLYEVAGKDAGYANRPLKPGDQAIRVVPLSNVAKLILHND